MAQFTGKVALVTGGGSGIGREIALAFAREGASVMVVDVVERGASETVNLIRSEGGKAEYVLGDVSKLADVQHAVQQTVQTYGKLNYACNNAGIAGESAVTAEMSEANWNRVIGINLSSVFFGIKAEIPELLKAGGGVIINTASILGVVGFASSAAYTSAKHGVVGLTKTAALEYATQGIRVNAIAPGFIYTPLIENGGMGEGTDAYNYISGLHAMKRMGKPSEVADAVIWLCSDKASFVTGATILIDGGYTAQ